MKNLIVRSITGIFFVTAIVVSFLEPIAMTALFALVTGMTVWEYCGLINDNKGLNVNKNISTLAGVILFLAMAVYCSGYLSSGIVFLPYLLILVCLFIAGLYEKVSDPLEDLAYTMLGQIYIALPLSMINVLAFNVDAGGYVVYNKLVPLCVFIFLWANDTGAYCFGSMLGKHKLFKSVSPNKTWEGSIGGAVVVLIAAAVIGSMNDTLSTSFQMTIPQWMGLGLIVVVFGTYGDLVESRLKRILSVKDSGNILPGHGGMLDRFDSSLLAMPAAVLYMFAISAF